MSKKFLWGSVNYKTETYLPWQLKIAYEFNNSEDFDYIIVDNNPVHVSEFWESLKKDYPSLKYIPHTPVDVNRTSGEHGSGLDVILNYAKKNNYQYLILNDPDFFWVQKNLLDWMEREVKGNGYVAIGAPYTIPLQHFDYNTPCAFGACYTMKFLEGISFKCHKDQHQVVIGGKDVGWEIRQKLAQTRAKHLTFRQSDVPTTEFVGGSHETGMHYSFQALLKQYYIKGKKIAYHLHRGSFSDHLDNYSKENWRSDRSIDIAPPPDLWTKTRNAYCEKYFQELQNSQGL